VEPNDRPDPVDLTAEAVDAIADAAPVQVPVPVPVATDAPVAAVDVPAQTAPEASDELEVLAGIEQDFAAVEEAMAGLDRVDAQELGGIAAAAQVEAIVGSGRFDVAT
jgi:hypothetical protein